MDLFLLQVGDVHESAWLRPEDLADDGAERPVQIINSDNPGTDLTSEIAAALAAGSMVFRDSGWKCLSVSPYVQTYMVKATLLAICVGLHGTAEYLYQ